MRAIVDSEMDWWPWYDDDWWYSDIYYVKWWRWPYFVMEGPIIEGLTCIMMMTEETSIDVEIIGNYWYDILFQYWY